MFGYPHPNTRHCGAQGGGERAVFSQRAEGSPARAFHKNLQGDGCRE